MTTTQTFPKAFGVWFGQTIRWNVSFFKIGNWNWDKNVIQPVSAFTNPIVESLSFADAKEHTIPIISKITFNGELVLKEANEYKSYKGRLFLVRPNSILFSKINARRGCIYFVPDKHREFAVSGEYPVLKIDKNIVIGEYLNLALRVGPARESLLGAASGMAKARTYLEDFQSVQIPLPSLDEQKNIVAAHRQAQAKVAKAQERVSQVEQNIENRFFIDLGLTPPQIVKRPKLFAIYWNNLSRWGVRQTTDNLLGLDQLPKASFDYRLLGEIAKVSYGIQKSPTNRPGLHARPYLRVANVRKGYLDLTEIKEINVPDNELQNYLLESGDILFVEGNGSRAELGRVAKWSGEIPNCVHQNHLIKVRVNQEILSPDFAMTWFNTEFGRGHFFRSAKTSSGLGTINSEEVRLAPIPLPPLEVQKEIMLHVEEGRYKIRQEQEAAAKIAEESEKEVERMILGLSTA